MVTISDQYNYYENTLIMIKFFIYIILILTYARQQTQDEIDKIDKNDTLEMIENKQLIDYFRNEHYQQIIEGYKWEERVYRSSVIAQNKKRIIRQNKKQDIKYQFQENSFIVYTRDQFRRLYLNTMGNDSNIRGVYFSKFQQYFPQLNYKTIWQREEDDSPFTLNQRLKSKINSRSMDDQIKIPLQLYTIPKSPKNSLPYNKTQFQEDKILAAASNFMLVNGRKKQQIEKIIQRYRSKINYHFMGKQDLVTQMEKKTSQQYYSDLVHQQMKNVQFQSDFSNNRTHRLFFLQNAYKIMTYKQVYQYIQNVDWTCLSGQVRFTKFCGSSYATAVADSIAAMFGIYLLGYHIYLSGQDIMDCARNSLVFGCQGGFIEGSFLYAVKQGLRDGYNYPLREPTSPQLPQQNCEEIYGQKPIFSIRTFKPTGYKDCRKLLIALQSQPVVVGIDGQPYRFYKKGTIMCQRGRANAMNHAVLVVGFRKIKGFKIKNSWGTQWGEFGYMWLKLNGNCPICNVGFYPVPNYDEGYQLYSQNQVYASCPPP